MISDTRNIDLFNSPLKNISLRDMEDLRSISQSVIGRGFTFLSNMQENNGEFPTYISKAKSNNTTYKIPPSPFVTAKILLLLSETNLSSRFQNLISTSLGWLLKCANTDLTYSFFHPSQCNSYPADIDDTSIIWSVLLKFGRKTRQGLPLTYLNKFKKENGLISTWLDDRKINPIDDCIQSNILGLIYEIGNCRNAIEERLQHILDDSGNNLVSPYYDNPLMFYLSLTRLTQFEKGKWLFSQSLKIREQINNLVGKNIKSPLAFSVKVLADERLTKNVDFSFFIELINMQKEDGSWPAEPIFNHQNSEFSYSSPSFSTALSITAISKVLSLLNSEYKES